MEWIDDGMTINRQKIIPIKKPIQPFFFMTRSFPLTYNFNNKSFYKKTGKYPFASFVFAQDKLQRKIFVPKSRRERCSRCRDALLSEIT
jgi:hypothetical protein